MLTFSKAEKIIIKIPYFKKGTLMPVGSFMRGKDKIADLDFVTTEPLKEIKNYFDKKYGIKKILSDGKKINRFILGNNVEINLWHSNEEEFPFLIFAFSYPKQFNIAIRRKAKNLGYKLTQKGLFDEKGNLIKIDSIEDIFNILDIPFRTPEEEELRENKYGNLSFKEAIIKIRK